MSIFLIFDPQSICKSIILKLLILVRVLFTVACLEYKCVCFCITSTMVTWAWVLYDMIKAICCLFNKYSWCTKALLRPSNFNFITISFHYSVYRTESLNKRATMTVKFSFHKTKYLHHSSVSVFKQWKRTINWSHDVYSKFYVVEVGTNGFNSHEIENMAWRLRYIHRILTKIYTLPEWLATME